MPVQSRACSPDHRLWCKGVAFGGAAAWPEEGEQGSWREGAEKRWSERDWITRGGLGTWHYTACFQGALTNMRLCSCCLRSTLPNEWVWLKAPIACASRRAIAPTCTILTPPTWSQGLTVIPPLKCPGGHLLVSTDRLMRQSQIINPKWRCSNVNPHNSGSAFGALSVIFNERKT